MFCVFVLFCFVLFCFVLRQFHVAWAAQCQKWSQTSDSISASQALGLQSRVPHYLVLMLRTETWGGVGGAPGLCFVTELYP